MATMDSSGPSSRVSDTQREQAVISLRDHFTAGRLTREQFAARLDVAFQAEIAEDLARAQENLPQVGTQTESQHGRAVRFTLAVVAHVVRRGRLRLRRRSLVVSVLSDIDLDLRQATIEGPRAAVFVLTVLGNVDVYLPQGVNVEISGLTLFGHRRDWGRDIAPPDAPTVHVWALGCLGAMDVWRVPSGVRGRYSDVVRYLKRQQRDERTALPAGSAPDFDGDLGYGPHRENP